MLNTSAHTTVVQPQYCIVQARAAAQHLFLTQHSRTASAARCCCPAACIIPSQSPWLPAPGSTFQVRQKLLQQHCSQDWRCCRNSQCSSPACMHRRCCSTRALAHKGSTVQLGVQATRQQEELPRSKHDWSTHCRNQKQHTAVGVPCHRATACPSRCFGACMVFVLLWLRWSPALSGDTAGQSGDKAGQPADTLSSLQPDSPRNGY